METSKKILITGGAGYIGSAVAHMLIEQGASVCIYDDLSTGRNDKIHKDASFVQGDIMDLQSLERVFEAHAFDAVIHCAAKKVMYESESDPTKYFSHNVVGTLNVLSCMEKYSVPKIVFSSTAAVYAPTTDAHPVTEADALEPKSVYGRSKLMAEMLITEYARLKKIDSYIILRYFNVAGDTGLLYEEPHAEGVFPLLADAFKKGEPFSVFGDDYETKDGSAVRDYIHLYDLAQAHFMALESSTQSGIYNLGTSNGYTVLELIEAFKRVTKKEVEVRTMPRRQGDVPVMLADASHAGTTLGWTPIRTLDDMVESVARVYGLLQ